MMNLQIDLLQLPFAFVFTSPGPVMFNLGPFSVRWYGFLIASAVLIGVTLSQYLAQRRDVNPELIGDLAIWLVLAAIPCARLYYVAFQWENYAANPISALAIWQGGIAIHGAILGGALASWIFGRIHRISFWQLADLVAPSLILGQAIGRWGNFFNSEAFGSPTNLPWKLYIPPMIQVNGDTIYPRPAEYANVDYFHPTFLYESIWNLAVFGLLMNLFFRDQKSKPPLKVGTLFLVYIVAYSAGRVWIEGLRTDSLMLGPLRIAQLVSLSCIILGSLALWWLYAKPNRSLAPRTISGSSGQYASSQYDSGQYSSSPSSTVMNQPNSNRNPRQTSPRGNPRASEATEPPLSTRQSRQSLKSVNSGQSAFPGWILWTVLTALLLLLGVFLTNRATLLGGSEAPQSDAPTDVQSGETQSNSPDAAQPQATSEVAPEPQTGTVDPDGAGAAQLATAKAQLQSGSASNLNRAVVEAQKIPPDNPVYPQAQSDIERWSQGILDIAEGRARENNFEGAVAAAQMVPEANRSIHALAQLRIQEWQQQAEAVQANQDTFQQAQALIRSGQASSYNKAIEQLRQIEPEQPGYAAAQKQVDQWSAEILKIAQARAQRKQFATAVQAAQLVPEGTSSYDAAQKAISQWQAELKK